MMDAIASAPDVTGHIYTIVDIAEIDTSGADMRRVTVSKGKNLALTLSIMRQGILQPVGLRPLETPRDGKRYELAFGRRRVLCATEAGLHQVPAHIARWTDAQLAAINKAENMVRAEPHAVDQWCAVAELVKNGFTVAEAAEELGLDDRDARRMERLGRLHPDVLKLVEIEMPKPADLRIIANAPAKTQAIAAKGATFNWGGKPGVEWSKVAMRCRVERIPISRAIFDAKAHAKIFAEDIFAQPGDDDAITTDQVDKFLTLQRTALAERVQTQRAAKRRVEIVEPDTRRNQPAIPTGHRLVSLRLDQKPRRTEVVFTAVMPDGRIAEALCVDLAAEKDEKKKAAAKERQRLAAMPTPVQTSADSDDDGPAVTLPDDAGDLPEPAMVAGPRVTKAALAIIAKVKTEALRKRLVEFAAEGDDPDALLAIGLIALMARNIDVYPSSLRPEHLVAQVVPPGGVIEHWPGKVVRAFFAIALARILEIDSPSGGYRQGSGDAAEWIGAAIGAEGCLPRFDTAEFLAEVPVPILRVIAAKHGVKAGAKTSALREALIGRAPDWRPDAAVFGRPGPRPKGDSA